MGRMLRGLVSHGDACWQLEALAQPLRFPRVQLEGGGSQTFLGRDFLGNYVQKPSDCHSIP